LELNSIQKNVAKYITRAGFKPEIPVFESPKAVSPIDPSATLIGLAGVLKLAAQTASLNIQPVTSVNVGRD
jgi:hypothetical protein